MQFPPDVGFVIQIISFLLLWWVLKRWLFEPALRVLELRRVRITGELAEAERLQAEAAKMHAEYDAAIEKAKAAARDEIAAMFSALEAEQAKAFAAARAEAAGIVEGARVTIAAEVAAARGTLTRHVAELSVEAVERVLGRPVR
jgi:F-type H+-transporting ATPase subunit b